MGKLRLAEISNLTKVARIVSYCTKEKPHQFQGHELLLFCPLPGFLSTTVLSHMRKGFLEVEGQRSVLH